MFTYAYKTKFDDTTIFITRKTFQSTVTLYQVYNKYFVHKENNFYGQQIFLPINQFRQHFKPLYTLY
jgi:hypothetical protein